MDELIERLRAFEGSDELGNGDFSLLSEAAAALEAAREDAERYRWLRDNAGAWEVSRDPGEWTKCDTGEKYKPRVYFTAFGTGYGGMFLDDAIDAAMASANAKLREPNGSQEKQR